MPKKPKPSARAILVTLPDEQDARLRKLALEKTLTPTTFARILLIEALAERDKREALSPMEATA